MSEERQQMIFSKGFDISNANEYRKIKVGTKTLEDAILNLGSLKSKALRYYSKNDVIQALACKNIKKLREISDYFYNVSGIYKTACQYYAFLYRYDWYITSEIFDRESLKEDKINKDFVKILNFLDNSNIKKLCGEISLKVIRDGCYYGYMQASNSGLVLQDLPIDYCRSRYSVGDRPAIEFNMRFFDDKFSDIQTRMNILKMFPEEFSKGYILYKKGKLVDTNIDDIFSNGWYLLDPNRTIKFNLNGSDVPTFVTAIPYIIDLDQAQDLDRRKQMQQLLKVIVQKLPLDKNGELIFDVDEARDIHNNAVEMLKHAVGVDVLTTFAEIEEIDMSDNISSTTKDDLAKVERSVYEALGLSRNIFATEGNLSLEKSILQDEATMKNLLLQFEIYFNNLIENKSTNQKKYNFKFCMLQTTQYNYKDLAKMYKEQTQNGYSKVLPQVALGHSQSSIINTAYFENDVLHLSEVMIPPLMSSTMSSEDILGKKNQSNSNENQNSSEGSKTQSVSITETKEVGRPEKSDDEKSEKTIANKESMS